MRVERHRHSSDTEAVEPLSLTVPSFSQLGLRAIPQALEGAIIPAVLFLVVRHFAGLAAAIVVALGWSGVAIMRRVVGARRVPGLVIVGAAMAVLQAVLGLASGSAFVYFFQPSIGTAAVAVAFFVSVLIDRPLARRFAGDFCALPAHILADLHVHRFFRHVSVMWAVVFAFNAAATLALLMTQPTEVFVVLKTVLSVGVTAGTVAASVLWFRAAMTRRGMLVVVA